MCCGSRRGKKTVRPDSTRAPTTVGHAATCVRRTESAKGESASARIPRSSAMANASISPMTTTIADAAATSAHRTASAWAGSASTNARGRPCRKAAAARTSTAGCTVNRPTAAAGRCDYSIAAPMAALTRPTPETPTTIPPGSSFAACSDGDVLGCGAFDVIPISALLPSRGLTDAWRGQRRGGCMRRPVIVGAGERLGCDLPHRIIGGKAQDTSESILDSFIRHPRGNGHGRLAAAAGAVRRAARAVLHGQCRAGSEGRLP